MNSERAFSLVEAVVAAGILAAAIVFAAGAAGPLAESIGSAREAAAAAAVPDAVRAFLRAHPFDTAQGWLGQPGLLAASADGVTVALASDARWLSGERRHFAVTLVAREAPNGDPGTAAWVAFDVVIVGSRRSYTFAGGLRR